MNLSSRADAVDFRPKRYDPLGCDNLASLSGHYHSIVIIGCAEFWADSGSLKDSGNRFYQDGDKQWRPAHDLSQVVPLDRATLANVVARAVDG